MWLLFLRKLFKSILVTVFMQLSREYFRVASQHLFWLKIVISLCLPIKKPPIFKPKHWKPGEQTRITGRGATSAEVIPKMLDALMCTIVPLLTLTKQIPEMKDSISDELLVNICFVLCQISACRFVNSKFWYFEI